MQFPHKSSLRRFSLSYECHRLAASRGVTARLRNGLPQFDRSMSQRGRGHFPKDRTVIRSEPSKVRELVMSSNLRDTCCRRISTSQRGAYHVELPQPKIAAWAHAQELHAT